MEDEVDTIQEEVVERAILESEGYEVDTIQEEVVERAILKSEGYEVDTIREEVVERAILKSEGYEFVRFDAHNSHDILAAAYVLTMSTSRRDYRTQLNRFSPSKANYIVINDGYKKASRPLCEQKPVYDAVFSYAHIFRHAQEHHRGEPILLLEDDFFWKSDVSDLPTVLRDVKVFIDGSAELDHYWLGSIPLPRIPALRAPRRVGNHVAIEGRTLASHAVVHTPKGMLHFADTIRYFPCRIEFADPFMSTTRTNFRYTKQLCYQLFEDTPSQRDSWPPYLCRLTRLLALDKRAEPIWSSAYQLVDYQAALTAVLIFLVCVCVRSFINSRRAPPSRADVCEPYQ